jgi:SAM-dependent methyltransferase
MPGTLTALAPVEIPGHDPSGLGSPEHPMRIMTRRAAGLHPGPWDDAARTEVAVFFDALAPDWHTRTSPERDAVVADALARGVGDDRGDICVELGSGIGTYTTSLAQRWSRVLAVEVSLEMLRLAPADVGYRLLADGSRLPLADGVVAAIVLVNCFLFPEEIDRALAPDGVLVWVNSSGAETPIHLPPADVVAALPGRWDGVESSAGAGIWCVLRRSAG